MLGRVPGASPARSQTIISGILRVVGRDSIFDLIAFFLSAVRNIPSISPFFLFPQGGTLLFGPKISSAVSSRPVFVRSLSSCGKCFASCFAAGQMCTLFHKQRMACGGLGAIGLGTGNLEQPLVLLFH